MIASELPSVPHSESTAARDNRQGCPGPRCDTRSLEGYTGRAGTRQQPLRQSMSRLPTKLVDAVLTRCHSQEEARWEQVRDATLSDLLDHAPPGNVFGFENLRWKPDHRTAMVWYHQVQEGTMSSEFRLALIAAFLACLPASAEAANNLNLSKSNINREQCPAAGGRWMHGREGAGCYLPVPPPKNAIPSKSKSN